MSQWTLNLWSNFLKVFKHLYIKDWWRFQVWKVKPVWKCHKYAIFVMASRGCFKKESAYVEAFGENVPRFPDQSPQEALLWWVYGINQWFSVLFKPWYLFNKSLGLDYIYRYRVYPSVSESADSKNAPLEASLCRITNQLVMLWWLHLYTLVCTCQITPNAVPHILSLITSMTCEAETFGRQRESIFETIWKLFSYILLADFLETPHSAPINTRWCHFVFSQRCLLSLTTSYLKSH